MVHLPASDTQQLDTSGQGDGKKEEHEGGDTVGVRRAWRGVREGRGKKIVGGVRWWGSQLIGYYCISNILYYINKRFMSITVRLKVGEKKWEGGL